MATGLPSGVRKHPMTRAATIDVPPLVRQQASINLNELKAATSKRCRSVGTDMLKESPHLLARQGNLSELTKAVNKFGAILRTRDCMGESLLHAATRTNQVSVMQYLIDSGIDLNAVNNDGNTALHLAVTNAHIDAVHLLLKSGAIDTIHNKKMDAPLHIIARNNNTSLMQAFLEYPVKLVIHGYRKRTPLHIIAEFDNLEVCKVLHNSALLVQRYPCNFRLCCKDEDDLTPVHIAARKGSHRVLDYMLAVGKQHGYTAEVIQCFLDEENSTPLHSAIAGGNLEVVKVLLKHGANPTTSQEDQPPPLHVACSQGQLEMVEAMVQQCGKEILQHTDVRGLSVLHYCWTAVNSDQMVSYLMEQGADTTLSDSYGRTALHTAILAGSLTTVKELLSNGANPLAKDSLGCNSLHLAVLHKRTAIVHTLLKLPSSTQLVRELNNDGQSPIHCALKQKAGDLAFAMMSKGCCRTQSLRDEKGNSYLHLTAASGDWKSLSVLLGYPSCHKLINEGNKHGITALHYAAFNGHARCAEILLSKGAMSHKCRCGMTPFTMACYMGHADCAQVLHTAHPYQRDWTDDDGNSALHMAAKSGNPAVVTLTLDIGVPVTANSDQNCFFDLIIERGDTKSALAVIEHERWQECLDLHSPLRPHPMLQLIAHMPGVAKAVLDRSHTKASLDPKHPDYWEEFDFKYLRLNPASQTHDKEDVESEMSFNNSLYLTSPLTAKIKGHSNDDLQRANEKRQRYTPMEAVKRMAHYDRRDLLTHPVVKAYLKMKWDMYGKWIFMVQVVLHLLQIILLTTFIMVMPIQAHDPNDPIDHSNASNHSQRETFEYNAETNAIRITILVLCSANAIFLTWMLLTLRLNALNVLDTPGLWIQGADIVCIFLFLVPAHPNWEAGALAVFFGWIKITLHLQMFDLFGIYVTMFLSITRTVLKVLFVAILLITAFALSLYVLAGTVMEFSTIGFSFFNTFGYMLGEIQYEHFIGEQQSGNLPYSSVTFLLVITLAILLSIVMANLLIGLAVGDIEKIMMSAITEKVRIEIKMFSALDQSLPEVILRHCDKQIYRRHHSRFTSYIIIPLQRLLHSNIGTNCQSDDLEAPSCPNQNEAIQELAAIREQLKELTGMIKELREGQSHEAATPIPYEMDPPSCTQPLV